jgi:trans-aconitate methyltransferase
VTDFEWDPDAYLPDLLEEVPGYLDLQEAVAAATEGMRLESVLELGTGTGETALRVLARHPGIEIDGVYDVPSSVADQLAWLADAGFAADAAYVRPDLAVFVSRRRPPG